MLLRDVLADVPGQDFVDERLVPDTAAARFLAKLIEHARIDVDRNTGVQVGFVTRF